MRARYWRDPERYKGAARDHRVRNRVEITAAQRGRYHRNRSEILAKKQIYYLENIEQIKTYRRRNAELLRKAAKEYAARNKTRIAAQAKRRREATKERRSAQNKAWRKANREACRVIDQRKRFRRAESNAKLSTADWAKLLRRYDYRCAYCGDDGPLHMDHVLPLSRGGQHSIGNVLPACAPCNLSKHNKLLIEWKRQLSGPETVDPSR